MPIVGASTFPASPLDNMALGWPFRNAAARILPQKKRE
jgi:hypothetical protein